MTLSPKTSRSSRSQVSRLAQPERRGVEWKTFLTLLVLGLAVLAVYFPVRTAPGDNTLQGGDYLQLHLFRIRFAQEALFGPHPHLPGWYPRELLGTPFWSDVQNFPLLPNRLVLLLFNPLSAFAVGVILSAELAALFAFLYARTLGLSRIAAAAAGWTFACTGFFAARVLCGHLPLLEAYFALPLLLWLVHRCLSIAPGPDEAKRRSRALRLLGLSTTIVCFAGHPQIPAYAIAGAGAYAVWMNHRRAGLQRGQTMRILMVLGLAVGVAAFVLWPLMLLVARSTRVLPLDRPDNDIVFPYERLLAFILPWRDGWPPAVLRPTSPPMTYSNVAIYWETVCYVGLLPVAAALFWLARTVVRRVWPARPWTFVAALGIVGMLLALPPLHDALSRVPGTFLRSPARLVYFTLFALAMGFGAAIDWLVTLRPGSVVTASAVALVLVAQAIDLGRHDRSYIRTCQFWIGSPAEANLPELVGDGRAAIDFKITVPLNRELDDIGSFDSILLAKPYQALLDLGNLPPTKNSEYLDGSDLTVRALQVCAVRVMLTTKSLPGQPPRPADETIVTRKRIPHAAERVDFFPLASTVVADVPTIHQHLRDQQYDRLHRLLIPTGSELPPEASSRQPVPMAIAYARNSEDKMTISISSPQSGYLRIDEAWDPGWHATVDGKSVPLIAGDDVFLTLPLPAGYHKVQLDFSTPGAITGWIITVVCFGMLMWIARPISGPTRKG
jgi:hypothetical protein